MVNTTVRIVELLNHYEECVSLNPMHLKFKCSKDDYKNEEVDTYKDLISHVECDTERLFLRNSTRLMLINELSHLVIQVERDPRL